MGRLGARTLETAPCFTDRRRDLLGADHRPGRPGSSCEKASHSGMHADGLAAGVFRGAAFAEPVGDWVHMGTCDAFKLLELSGLSCTCALACVRVCVFTTSFEWL